VTAWIVPGIGAAWLAATIIIGPRLGRRLRDRNHEGLTDRDLALLDAITCGDCKWSPGRQILTPCKRHEVTYL
jgi:hypothetical protein